MAGKIIKQPGVVIRKMLQQKMRNLQKQLSGGNKSCAGSAVASKPFVTNMIDKIHFTALIL